MRNVVVTLSGLLLVAVFAACTELSRVEDSLANAIRDTGFVCAEVSSSNELAGDGSQWRVVCEDAHAYHLSLEQDGQICVSPIAYVDVPPAETRPRFQGPLKDVDVVRCTPEGAWSG